jgi:predicted lipoprotein with Yx(FWY)xxD motif
VIYLSLKLGILLLTAALAVAAATAMAETTGKNTVNVQPGEYGDYLVNETGFSLYYFVNDAPGNGTSTCSGACSELWPPFYVDSITVPAGLKSSDFTILQRADGKAQVAFKGWPLYLYSKDTAAGDINGQGFRNIWFVVNPNSFPPVST